MVPASALLRTTLLDLDFVLLWSLIAIDELPFLVARKIHKSVSVFLWNDQQLLKFSALCFSLMHN